MKIGKLIDEVRKIDEQAASYLKYEAPFLSSYGVPEEDDGLNELDNMMSWDETRQGAEYWEKIDKRMKKKGV